MAITSAPALWMNMTRREIENMMDGASVGADDEVKVVLAEGVEHLDELEPGSVLKVVDVGFRNDIGGMIIVEN